MDFKTFGELLSSLPFVRWLAPHASFIARGLSSLLLIIAGANICFYLFGLGRDDIYTTERVEGTPFIVTKPRLIHESFKDYDFFLALASTTAPSGSTPPNPPTIVTASATAAPIPVATPAGLPRPVLGNTAVVTVSAASGVLLLPRQTLVFTFTPSIYDSQRVVFRNDLSEVGQAKISLTDDSGTAHTFSISHESPFDALARRIMIIDSWNALVLIVPFILFFFSQLFLMQKDLLEEKARKLKYDREESNRKLIENIRQEVRSGNLSTAKQLSENLQQDFLTDQQKKIVETILSSNTDWHFQCLFSKRDMVSLEQSPHDEIKDRVEYLISSIPRTNNFYLEALSYQNQLIENINTSARQGDNEIHRSDRARILEQLSRISIDVLNQDLNNLPITSRRYGEEDLKLNSSSEYLNEHLSWLIFPKKHTNLSVNLLADILEYNKQQRDGEGLDANIHKQVENLYQLNRHILPPSYFADLTKTCDLPYIDALNLTSYFLPEDQYEIIAIHGKQGSGKTTTLKYFGQAFHTPTTFYAFITLDENHQTNEDLVNSFQIIATKTLMDIFLEHPYVWLSLNKQRNHLGTIFQQSPLIFHNGDPIGNLKRMRKSRDNIINRSRRDMIDWLQDIRKSTLGINNKPDHSSILLAISDVLEKIGYNQIYISFDDAPRNFNPMEYIDILNGSIDQKILLRVAYSEYKEDEHAFDDGFVKVISLDTWSSDKIDDIFVAVFGQGNRFDADGTVRGEFTRVVDVPGDLLIWSNVFDVCYPDAYVSRPIWDRVCEAMRQARNELNAEHWNTLVSARAIELLQNAAAHDHE